MTAVTLLLPLDALVPSPTNPRKRFDESALAELAESIRAHDVLQPVLVRPLNGGERFEIVAGERRWRAAKLAGLTDIPALVREISDAQVLEMQVVENLQRADLHPLEEAEGYEILMKRHDYGADAVDSDIMARLTAHSRPSTLDSQQGAA